MKLYAEQTFLKPSNEECKQLLLSYDECYLELKEKYDNDTLKNY